MKLREDVQKNRVWTHGSVYVDHNEFILICPECCSDKVEKVYEFFYITEQDISLAVEKLFASSGDFGFSAAVKDDNEE